MRWKILLVPLAAALNLYGKCDAIVPSTCCQSSEGRVAAGPGGCLDGDIVLGQSNDPETIAESCGEICCSARGTFTPGGLNECLDGDGAAFARSLCDEVCCDIAGVAVVLPLGACTEVQPDGPPPGIVRDDAFCAASACCELTSGDFVPPPEGKLCADLPAPAGVKTAPAGQCEQVCCDIAGVSVFTTRGACTAVRPDGPPPGIVRDDAFCDPGATTDGTSTTGTDTTTSTSTSTSTGQQSSLSDTGTDSATSTGETGSTGSSTGSSTGGPGGSCTCEAVGVSFSIVSGCVGPAFDDALQPSYCKSVVEFQLGGDPATHTFMDGEVLGFPDCQVKIDCP